MNRRSKSISIPYYPSNLRRGKLIIFQTYQDSILEDKDFDWENFWEWWFDWQPAFNWVKYF